MSDAVATSPPDTSPAPAVPAALGTCGHCKAAVVDSKSLRCAACSKPFSEAGLTPASGWVRARMLMWYAIGATMIIVWLTPHSSPLQTLLRKTGWEIAIRWAPVFLVFAFSLIALIQGLRKTKGAAGCGRCGYSIDGLTTLSCPECGSDLRLEGIAVGKPATGAFIRRTHAYTAARWITLAILAVALTLGIHAFVPFPYQYIGSTQTIIPLASPVGTTFTAESYEFYLCESTIRKVGDPLPFPSSYIEVTINSGRGTPTLRTLHIGIDEDLMIDRADPSAKIQILSNANLSTLIHKLIPSLTADDAFYSARRIIMSNRPRITMTFPTTGTSLNSTPRNSNVSGIILLGPQLKSVPPFTLTILPLIFAVALFALHSIALRFRQAAARLRTIPASTSESVSA